jgi:hypothetical protein
MVMMAGKTFWYKLLDLMHYAQMHITSPMRGYIVVNKLNWAQAFYKGEQTSASDRAWERWKGQARKEDLLCALPGDEDETTPVGGQRRPSTAAQRPNYRVVIHVGTAFDAIYFALGAPHPGGLLDQIRCEQDNRARLLPEVVRGIAAAARVEQRRRLKAG